MRSFQVDSWCPPPATAASTTPCTTTTGTEVSPGTRCNRAASRPGYDATGRPSPTETSSPPRVTASENLKLGRKRHFRKTFCELWSQRKKCQKVRIESIGCLKIKNGCPIQTDKKEREDSTKRAVRENCFLERYDFFPPKIWIKVEREARRAIKIQVLESPSNKNTFLVFFLP
jgi:hypothetical protein